MTWFEMTWNTDDPVLAAELAEIDKMPRGPERLRIEAALCQWWANRCLEEAGRQDGRDLAFAHNRRGSKRAS